MRNSIISMVALFFPYRLIKKMQNLKLLILLKSYSNYMVKNCKQCSADVLLYNPVSIKGTKYMSIGENFKLGFGGRIEAWDSHNGISFSPNIVIGNNVSLGNNCHIGAINEIFIEDGVLAGADVLIIDHNHGKCDVDSIASSPNNRKLYSSGKVHIKENVWLGDKVSILPGVTIGRNCIIGANSVVTCDIPDNVVACGSPARVVRRMEVL